MLTLTPDLCRAAYDALNLTKPFCDWNLPHGEDVTFKVLRTPLFYADHSKEPRKPKSTIRISSAKVSTWHRLIAVLAHEMVHLYLDHNQLNTRRHHGKAFQKSAAAVCRHHRDFDAKDF